MKTILIILALSVQTQNYLIFIGFALFEVGLLFLVFRVLPRLSRYFERKYDEQMWKEFYAEKAKEEKKEIESIT
jgi:hypothetical protein